MTHTSLTALGLVLSLGLAASGCAAGPRSEAPQQTPRRQLLGDEIRAATVSTAHDAVARLRPEWLRRRGQISMRMPEAGDVVVYLNGVHYGDLMSLHRIPAASVIDMQFLSGVEATTRFGTGHGGGVIMVRTQ